jgi:hypothetical protein
MQYFAKTVEEKNELCKKGLKCKGMHRVFDGGKPTGAVKWEFDVAEPKGVPPMDEPQLSEDQVKVRTAPPSELPHAPVLPPSKPVLPPSKTKSKKRGKTK